MSRLRSIGAVVLAVAMQRAFFGVNGAVVVLARNAEEVLDLLACSIGSLLAGIRIVVLLRCGDESRGRGRDIQMTGGESSLRVS